MHQRNRLSHLVRVSRPQAAGARLAALVLGLACCNGLQAQSQVVSFLDDSQVQVVNLSMDAADWAALQANYQLNTYYKATFNWNGTTLQVGVRSHGGGSRSPLKPNLDVNFGKVVKSQTFLGLPHIVLKANNQDASNLREWLTMKLFRRLGIVAPREAPAQVYLNGELLGFYFIVEHLNEATLQRNFGESGGYLYEWQDTGSYEFGDLGSDPQAYAPLVDLKTNQSAPDLQNLTNLVQLINRPASDSFNDDQFIAELSKYLQPELFLRHIAVESVLAESDGICGGVVGMNNFYLYQFQGRTLYQLIAWDKDNTFSDYTRDVLFGISTGPNQNLLAQRLLSIPHYRSVFYNEVAQVMSLVGATGGWADQAVSREYNLIRDAASNDPHKQCPLDSGLAACGAPEFEAGVDWLHTFLHARSVLVTSMLAARGVIPGAVEPVLPADSVTAWGASTSLSPGAWAIIHGVDVGTAAQTSADAPRSLGDVYVAIEGVRAPLSAVASDGIWLQVPADVPTGSAGLVLFRNGVPGSVLDVAMQAATPNILAVLHADGSAVSPQAPPQAGETLSILATGLGVVGSNIGVGAMAPADPLATTLATPAVMANGIGLPVGFSGLVPGLVGFYRVDVTLPTDALPASFSLTLGMGGLEPASWQIDN